MLFILIALVNRKKIKILPSVKLSNHSWTQILLVKLHTRHSRAIYLSNVGFKGPWRLFSWSHKDPETYISSFSQLRQTQHSTEGSSLPTPFQLRQRQHQHQSQQRRRWRGALVFSKPAYIRPAQCLHRLPAAEATASKHQHSAKCPASHTQKLSRNLLSYS